MTINQITPDQAKATLDEDPGSIYVDVRSVPEFTAGHPAGAINIPILHMIQGQMAPNPDFKQVVQKILPKDKKLIVGCKSGGRSQSACQLLQQLGYTDLSNVAGGFGEWQGSGLPVSQENGDGVSYESLSEV